jgi:hypothetical protein
MSILIMQTIDKMRPNLDCRPAYIGNFKMAKAPVAVVQPDVKDSGTKSLLQRATKIPDYRSVYIGNFQMAPTPVVAAVAPKESALGVDGSGTMGV